MTSTTARIPAARAAAVVLLCTALTSAVAADTSLDGSRTVCTHPEAALPRVVQVLYETSDAPIPCKVLYEKDGAVEELAQARNTSGHCEKIERKVVGNLTRGGYACEHTFTGALAAADRSVTLDLFSENDAGTGATGVEAGASGSAATGPRADAGGLSVEPMPAPIPSPALDHEHTYTHSHPIGEDGGSALEHTHTTTFDVAPADAGDELAASDGEDVAGVPTAPDVPDTGTGLVADAATVDDDAIAGSGGGARAPASTPRHAVLSRALATQSDAHRFAAELRRSFPNVETRVARRADADGGWHVALGVGTDAQALEVALATLGDDVRALFEIVPLAVPADASEPLVIVQDDWARYAVASCYAGGRRTAAEIAECANVIVDADAFVDCLGGGLCAPARFREGTDVDAIDLAAVLGAEDPVAAARDKVVGRLQGCERLNGASEREFAECAALAVLDDDHRDVYDCYRRSASELALIECAGSESMADYAMAYERCGTSGYEASACLLENSGNDYLESAAYCLGFEDAAEAAACSVEANLSDDDALMLDCLTDYTESSERTICLARERLDDTEYAAIECGSLAGSVTEYGLCVGERSGAMSHEALHAARCLDGADVSTDTLLDCAGGQFAGEDIGDCIEFGLADPRCFETETLISQVANDTVDDYLQLVALDNEIARFRQELYALEGGDLAQILTREDGSGFAAVEQKVEKTTGGLRGLLGFGRK